MPDEREEDAAGAQASARSMRRSALKARLNQILLDRAMSQSDLARESGVPRGLISSYCRGTAWPTAANLRKITLALGFRDVRAWLPEAGEALEDAETAPSFEARTVASSPGLMWVRMNRIVSIRTVEEIVEALKRDKLREQE